MAKPSQTICFIILYFLVVTPPHPTQASLSFSQLRTIFSLSHSLFSRVSNLRASRGDVDGARRAQLIATKLQHGLGLGLWPTLWSMGWDYIKNYAWRDTVSFRDAVAIIADLNQLASSLTELGRLKSDSQRAQWVSQNYKHLVRVSKSMFNHALTIFSKSGPLRELVEILQKEMEGECLKDFLEVGTNDFKGLIQILKDLASQYTHVDDHQEL